MTERNENNGVSRRFVLAESWTWLRWFAWATLIYPVYRFLAYRTPKQPRYVKVDKVVPTGGFALEHDFILFVDETGPWAVSRKCTHLGCRLNYQDKEGILLCPCHQSRFSKTGERISGPARKNLPRFAVAKRQEGNVDKGYIVTL
ncbi:QcrA and Rieske domain-containing protein [Thiovibrio sp. JS02]